MARSLILLIIPHKVLGPQAKPSRLGYKSTENKAGRFCGDGGCGRGQYYRHCFARSLSTTWRPLYQTTLKSQRLQMTPACSAAILASWPPKLPCKKPSRVSRSGAGITRWRSTQRSNLHEARWQPTIHLECQPLRFTPLPKLLGVTIDRALALGQHIANINAKAAGRCRVLTSLTSKQWGWGKDQLTKIYKVLYLSVLMNGAPAWQPWLAANRLEQFERRKKRAFRVITDQLQTTLVEALRRKAVVCSITTLMRRQNTIAYEKATRLTSDHPHRRLLTSPVRHRLVRSRWCWATQSLIKELPNTLTSTEPLTVQIECPCARKGYWEIYPERVDPQQTIAAKAGCISTSNQMDTVLLARLRSGHTALIKACAHLLYPAANPTCPLCKEEVHTLAHCLQRCLNPGNAPLIVLQPHPKTSQPTPGRCWRSLGPPPRTLGARLNNTNNNHHRGGGIRRATAPAVWGDDYGQITTLAYIYRSAANIVYIAFNFYELNHKQCLIVRFDIKSPFYFNRHAFLVWVCRHYFTINVYLIQVAVRGAIKTQI